MKKAIALILFLTASTSFADDKPVHVFILSGQSNMAGMDPETGFVPEANALFGNEEVVYIKVAKGGQPICRWVKEWADIAKEKGINARHRERILKGKGVLFYQPILDQYRKLLEKHPKPNSVTFCWMQGERDANGGADAAYKDALKLLIAKLRRDLKRPDMNVVIGRIGDYALDRPSCVAVRNAQREIANEDPRGAWVDVDDLNDKEVKGKMQSVVHYTKEGYITLGRRFARQGHALVTGKTPAKDGRPRHREAKEGKPYADGFPKPVPSSKAPAIDLKRNEQGLLVRSEKSHEEAAARVNDYLQTQYLPKVREHYPDQDSTAIKLVPRPDTDGLGVHENLVYARWGQRAMVLDLYLPKRKDEDRLPLVIFIHGGGWVRGSHRGYRPAAIALAKRGFATATVEYRVAGEAMFPAAIYDVKAAIRWLRAQSERFHLDPARFGITGGSAGGNIAVLTAVTFGDSRFEGPQADGPANHPDQSSEIQCVVSLYGAMSWTASPWTNSKRGSDLMNETLPDFHIAGGSHLPPILFLNEWDRRKDRRWGADTMEIIKEVGKAGRAELTLINAPHGFIYFSPHQDIALDHLEKFFGKHLGQKTE